MNKLWQKREEGFTLIEVVIVLAIAAMILIAVFIAVSGANKARRDSQRQGDASRFLAAIEQNASQNSGTYPTVAVFNAAGYAATVYSGKDPDGATYTLTAVATTYGATSTVQDTMFYAPGNDCSNTSGLGANVFAVYAYQENGNHKWCATNK